jgi:hypothetical protein
MATGTLRGHPTKRPTRRSGIEQRQLRTDARPKHEKQHLKKMCQSVRRVPEVAAGAFGVSALVGTALTMHRRSHIILKQIALANGLSSPEKPELSIVLDDEDDRIVNVRLINGAIRVRLCKKPKKLKAR